MNRDRLYQLAFLAVAAAALAGGALLQDPIEQARLDEEMDILGRGIAASKDPRIALIQRVPGGLRAPLVNSLWIRAQNHKQEGQFFDAKGLRDLICEMLPHHTGVWSFCAWDMAWNISVATHTDAERWMWVHNGIKLLRDKGLLYNPEQLALYKDLSWIYFAKCGQYTDEMHRVYKRRWAEEMDWVVGAPPVGDTAEVIAAFRLIADAPKLENDLLADEAVAELVAELVELQAGPGAAFLRYYNRFADDPLVGELDASPRRPREGDERERRIAALMRLPDHAEPMAKVLAFSRRKVLEETYRLEARWMLALMQKYGPFEWRHVDSHAVYWATYGLHRAEGLTMEQIKPGIAEAKIRRFIKLGPENVRQEQFSLEAAERLNTERNVLMALKSLTRTGRLFVRPSKDAPGVFHCVWSPDWRFIEPTQREYVAGGLAQVTDDEKGLAHEDNVLRAGHVTFLEDVVLQLFFGGREPLAQQYYDRLVSDLKPNRRIYEGDPTLREFVQAKVIDLRLPPADLARTFWSGALRAAYLSLAEGETQTFGAFRAFAFRAYTVYVNDVSHAERLTPMPFPLIERAILTHLMLRPQSAGAKLSLLTKSQLYKTIESILIPTPDGPVTMQQLLYPAVAQALRQECEKEGLDFDLAFPAPKPLEIADPAER